MKFNIPEGLLEGKGLLIAIVIVISSLNFTLGFFTGKTLSDKQYSGTKAATEIVNVGYSDAANNRETLISDFAVDNGAAIDEPSDMISFEEPEFIDPAIIFEETETGREAKSKTKDREVDSSDAIENKRNRIPVTKNRKDQASKSTGKEETEEFYIQVGAFHSVKEAKKMQVFLKDKGFESIISIERIKKKLTFYKVRIQGYKSKEEASKVLENLNKHGLNGFIKQSKPAT